MNKSPCLTCEYAKQSKDKPPCSSCTKTYEYADQFGAAGIPNGRKENIVTEEQTKFKLTPTGQVETKPCTKCGKTKPIDTGFTKNSTQKDGYDTVCRDCKNTHQNEYRAKVKKRMGIVSEAKAAVKYGPKPVQFEGPATTVDVKKHMGEPIRGPKDTGPAVDPKSRYYDAGGIETINIIKAKLTPEQYQGFLMGNALKYLCRANFKEDLGRDVENVATYIRFLKDCAK